MDLILDILGYIVDLVKKILQWLADWFLELNIFDRILVSLTIPAFFAVILPVARYKIFELWTPINNPYAVEMIYIVCLIFVSFFIPSLYALILRVGANLFYLGWIIYAYASHTISHAPYEITGGFWINIVVPLTYCVVAGLSFLFYGQDR